MRLCFQRLPTADIAPGIPHGHLTLGETWVQSRPLTVLECRSQVILRGKLDAAARWEDGTQGIIDFKVSRLTAACLTLYSRQLHTYLLAAQQPAPGQLHLDQVSTLGVLAFTPAGFRRRERPSGEVGAYLGGTLEYRAIPRDEAGFLAFLRKVIRLLDRPAPPPSRLCPYCLYRKRAASLSR
jgi:hypothetical protein